MRPLSIGFVHPDLGIGGAERLVVDAALALQGAGHRVTIHTTHHDSGRCFEETRDGTLAVRVHDSAVPRHIAGRFLAPCAIARTVHAARAAALAGHDLVFCDVVAHSIAALRRRGTPVVFYCHYPDKLLAPRGGLLRAAYRWPIDHLEESAIGRADLVLANSRYTAQAFARAYPRLRSTTPVVLYPGVETGPPVETPEWDGDEILLLSLSRFECRKNLELAVDSFARLRDLVDGKVRSRLRLCLAGGYDERLEDNRRAIERLRAVVARRGLQDAVRFETNVSRERKQQLLHASRAVVYTPAGEHFGYVPVEAMACGRPVVVCNEGGPTETVEHGKTGFHCAPTADAFAEALRELVVSPALAASMGAAGAVHVRERFSMEKFRSGILEIVGGIATR